ncbi:MAG: hypothetical protein ACPHF4_15760, partial [Rubripirellula sp.]
YCVYENYNGSCLVVLADGLYIWLYTSCALFYHKIIEKVHHPTVGHDAIWAPVRLAAKPTKLPCQESNQANISAHL